MRAREFRAGDEGEKFEDFPRAADPYAEEDPPLEATEAEDAELCRGEVTAPATGELSVAFRRDDALDAES